MSKWITVDFWDVFDLNDQPADLLQLMERISAMPVAARMRNRDGPYMDFITEIVQDGMSAAFGTLLRIRLQDWPPTVDLNDGSVEALALADGKSIAEEMGFYFDRSLRVLVTQRHQFFRASALIKLIQELTNTPLMLQPKLRQDAAQRLQRMTRIGSVELKIVGGLGNLLHSSNAPSVGRLIEEAAAEINALSVEVQFSVGRHQGETLNIAIVRRLTRLLGRGEPNVAVLQAKGSHEGERAEVVDFVHDRLIFSGEVEYYEKQLDREQCRQLLKRAVAEHRQYLQDQLA